MTSRAVFGLVAVGISIAAAVRALSGCSSILGADFDHSSNVDGGGGGNGNDNGSGDDNSSGGDDAASAINSACYGRPPCASACAECSYACVDTTADPNNCGGCGTVCNRDLSCIKGSCICPATKTTCSGVCVDTTSDVTNCGKCGNTCDGGLCFAGSCSFPTVLASNLASPSGISVRGGYVYFTTDVVERVSTTGGAVKTLGGTSSPPNGNTVYRSLPVDDAYVYWFSSAGIEKVPVAGGAATVLVPSATGAALAIDATYVYWQAFTESTYSISDVPIATGAVHALASPPGGAGDGDGIATFGGAVYANAELGLYKTTSAGGSATEVYRYSGEPLVSLITPLVVDATGAYVVRNVNSGAGHDDGEVLRIPFDSNASYTDLGGIEPGDITDIAIDNDTLYMAFSTGIAKIPKKGLDPGETATVLAIDMNQPVNIAVDDTSIYWVSSGSVAGGLRMSNSGTVSKIAKSPK